MLCPRREENPGPFNLPAEDAWQDRDGARCCSYCGSLHPDDFMQAVRDGVELVPTDKSYKVYVEGRSAGAGGKFYFQHLDEPQGREFVELHNAGKLKLGYPGRFYVMPFFMRRGP